MAKKRIDRIDAGGGIMVDVVELVKVKAKPIKRRKTPANTGIAHRAPKLPGIARVHKKIQPKGDDHNVNYEDVPGKMAIVRKTRTLINEHQRNGETVRLYYIDCGKPKCKACARGPSHGPYWYGFRRDDKGRQVSYYIGKNLRKDDDESST